MDGKVGWFPETYAEKVDGGAANVSSPDAVAAPSALTDSVVEPGAANTAVNDAAPAAAAAAAVDAVGPVSQGTAKVLFDWASEDGTFKLEQGQEVEVWRTDVDGWSLGKVNDTPG